MNILEENYEWNVRYHEYLGIMVGDGKPTERQAVVAKAWADEAIRKLKLAKPHPGGSQNQSG